MCGAEGRVCLACAVQFVGCVRSVCSVLLGLVSCFACLGFGSCFCCPICSPGGNCASGVRLSAAGLFSRPVFFFVFLSEILLLPRRFLFCVSCLYCIAWFVFLSFLVLMCAIPSERLC